MSQVGIRWSFNPPASSHHGGVWERMIRLMQRVLTSAYTKRHWMLPSEQPLW